MAAHSPLNSRITLSRTLPPTLPDGYLSRKHLFPLIDNQAPGTTMLIAPAGYGKTALVTEWAKHYKEKTIWLTLTESDPLSEMSALFIQATRNVIPGFGSWFEAQQPMRPTDVVKHWGNELLATGKEYVFVLDSLRENYGSDLNVSVQLIEQFPSNVHLVVLRRTPQQELFDTCIARGNTKVIGPEELRFNSSELAQLSESVGTDFENPNLKEVLHTLNGWPSASSLAIHHFAHNPESKKLSDLLTHKGSPLQSLAELTFNGEKEDTQEILIRLSIVEEFTHEVAQLLLEDKYSFEKVIEIASHGEVFSRTNDPKITYRFSPLMREIANAKLQLDRTLKARLDAAIAAYYESISKFDTAMDHYFACGNQERVSALFRNACRVKQAQGLGDDLIRWSEYAGKSPVDGPFKKSSVLISGFISNLDFEAAQSEVQKVRLTLHLAQDQEFFEQFIASASCFIYLSQGNFSELMKSAERAFPHDEKIRQESEEQVMALRLIAFKHLVLDEHIEMEKLLAHATSASSSTLNDYSHAYLGAIKSMSLLMKSEFNQAYEMAALTINAFQRLGIAGFLGPIDLYYVQARCLLEFGRRDDALELFTTTATLAKSWRHWPIYFFSRGAYIRDLALRQEFALAFEEIKRDRELIDTFYFDNQLQSIVDLADMFVRYHSKTWDRFDALIETALNTRLKRQTANLYFLETNKRSFESIGENLEAPTALDEIYLHLFNAGKVIDRESEAIIEMRKALKIGARIGSRETFLRQGPELGSLIIKVAVENPTLYNENLARDMAERMKEREMTLTNPAHLLTKRELEILRHLSTGRTLTVIASELHISQNTMKTHLKNLYRKLEAEDRNDAVQKAQARSII